MSDIEAMRLDLYRRMDEANDAITFLADGSQKCNACGATGRTTKIGSTEPLRKGLLEMAHTHDCPHTAELERRLHDVFPGFAAANAQPPTPLPPRRWWRLAWQHPCVDGHAWANLQQYRIGATRGYLLACRRCGVAARHADHVDYQTLEYLDDPSL